MKTLTDTAEDQGEIQAHPPWVSAAEEVTWLLGAAEQWLGLCQPCLGYRTCYWCGQLAGQSRL